ncbi:MAG TPA: DUF1697 domain-containing protein [Polyangiaceae bacterium]|nr:DUF1697 domain-containing protein [Polyangiaceae bacterium]
MPRYAAFLRGVSPMNLKMPVLKAALEEAGFGDVKTLLSSGNVVFGGRRATDNAIEKKVQSSIEQKTGKKFGVIVRSIEELQALIEADPYQAFRLPSGSKRVVTFLRTQPEKKPKLPPALDGAQIWTVRGREALSSYVRSDKGPVFMTLIEKTFGKDVTTRTWDTVQKVARAGAG